MPEFSGVSHIAVNVRDMEKSLRFYRDLVGLKVLEDRSWDEPPDRHLHPAFRTKHTKRHMVMFDTGGGPKLVLIEYTGDRIAGTPPLLDDAGVSHFSLVVSGLKAFTERMNSMGAKAAGAGFWADPDGNLIQFEEPRETGAVTQRSAYKA